MSSDNFALHTDTGSGTAQKVYFGMNGESQQTWYIAGSDADNSIVLLCDPMLPMTTGCFDDKSDLVDSDYKTYDNEWNCTYGTAPSRVYANHYGASDLRLITLPSLESSAFSTSEQNMMLATKVYTDDDMLRDERNSEYTYYTTDKLYAAYGVYEEAIITVGENSADSLNSGLKVSLTSGPYTNDDTTKFYLRTPYLEHVSNVHYVSPGADKVGNVSLKLSTPYAVVPAFRLNLSSVLFASAATAATSDASLTDTLTFRVDDTEKIKSKAAYATCGVTVNYDECDGNVFLYVQDADSVYSVEITEDTIVALSDMTGINNLTDENTKIWLEKSEDNVAYAVMAEALLTEHIPNADDGDCTTAITCSICGTVTTEAKENHIDDNGDGICDHCDSYVEPKQEDEYYQIANAENLLWLAEQVNSDSITGFKAILTKDIVLPDNKWVPMDETDASVLDGNGHSITINCSNYESGFGLFARCNNSEVKNLILKGNIVVNTADTVGALCTSSYKSTFTNVISYVNITNSGTGAVGGLAGKFGGQDGSEISNCAVYADISGTTAGGLVGLGWDGYQYYNIKNSVYAGNVTGTTAGAIIGNHQTGNTTSVFSKVYWNETDGLGFFGTTNKTHDLSTVSAKTVEAFASGEVAYLLNGEKTDGTQSWYQTLETDIYPVPDSTHGTVYYGYISCDDNAQPEYTNQSDAQATKPDHVEGEEVFFTLDDDKAPTCTEGGVGHTECEKCHKVMQTNVTVEASGHTGETEVKDAREATCAVEGYTGDTYCKDCGAKIATGTVIPKSTIHTWDEGIVTKEPTPLEKGEKTHTCTVCKATKTEEIAALGAPEVGTKDTSDDGKATYKVTKSDLEKGTVTYVAPTNKKATTVIIPATVEIDGVKYSVTAIEKNAFKNNKYIESVSIGKNVKTIGASAFYKCTKLKTVTFGSNVTSIGDKAFYKCTALTKISLPSKLKTIGKSAFYGCKKVTAITIGKSVERIGEKAFYGCSKVKTITIKTTKLTTKKIGNKAFAKTQKSVTVKIPKKKFTTYKSMLIKKGVNKKAKFKKF